MTILITLAIVGGLWWLVDRVTRGSPVRLAYEERARNRDRSAAADGDAGSWDYADNGGWDSGDSGECGDSGGGGDCGGDGD